MQGRNINMATFMVCSSLTHDIWRSDLGIKVTQSPEVPLNHSIIFVIVMLNPLISHYLYNIRFDCFYWAARRCQLSLREHTELCLSFECLRIHYFVLRISRIFDSKIWHSIPSTQVVNMAASGWISSARVCALVTGKEYFNIHLCYGCYHWFVLVKQSTT